MLKMEDIYDDLENFERVAEYDQLKEENAKLRKYVQEMEEKVLYLSQLVLQDNRKLLDKFENIERNFNALLHTARAEIERKTEMIATLNMEKDQLIFRHIGNRNNPIKRRRSRTGDRTNKHSKRKRDEDIETYEENKTPRSEPADESHDIPTQNIPDDLNKRDNLPNKYSSNSPVNNSDHDNGKLEKGASKDHSGKSSKNSDRNVERYHRSEKEDARYRNRSPDSYEGDNRRRNKYREHEEPSHESHQLAKLRGTDRFSRSRHREEKTNKYRFSKSMGRHEKFDYDRCRRSQSPCPSLSSRSSRNFSSNNTKVRSTHYGEDRYRNMSPRKNSKEMYKRNTDITRGEYSNTSHKNKPQLKSKGTCEPDLHETSSKEEIPNYLSKMEEEYAMHPGNINELQLDEETKDHYHNDSLKLQSKEDETIVENKVISQPVPSNEIIEKPGGHIILCQSPDVNELCCNDIPDRCIAIQDKGFLTPMDDPRLYHLTYFEDEYIRLNKISKKENSKEVSQTILLNLKSRISDIELKMPAFQKEIAIWSGENSLITPEDLKNADTEHTDNFVSKTNERDYVEFENFDFKLENKLEVTTVENKNIDKNSEAIIKLDKLQAEHCESTGTTELDTNKLTIHNSNYDENRILLPDLSDQYSTTSTNMDYDMPLVMDIANGKHDGSRMTDGGAKNKIIDRIINRNSDSEPHTDGECETPEFATSTPKPNWSPLQDVKKELSVQGTSEQENTNRCLLEPKVNLSAKCEDASQFNGAQSENLNKSNNALSSNANRRLIIVRRRRVIVTRE